MMGKSRVEELNNWEQFNEFMPVTTLPLRRILQTGGTIFAVVLVVFAARCKKPKQIQTYDDDQHSSG